MLGLSYNYQVQASHGPLTLLSSIHISLCVSSVLAVASVNEWCASDQIRHHLYLAPTLPLPPEYTVYA